MKHILLFICLTCPSYFQSINARENVIIHDCIVNDVPGSIQAIHSERTWLQNPFRRNAVNLPDNLLNQHGILIAYFKNRTVNKYAYKNASAYLYGSEPYVLSTVAHALVVCDLPDDTEKTKEINKKFLEEFEPFASKVSIFTRSGAQLKVATYVINPLYFSTNYALTESGKKNYDYIKWDTALLYLAPDQPLPIPLNTGGY